MPGISGQSTHEGAKSVNPNHRPPLPQETSLTLFLLKAESILRSRCGRKDYVNENSQWTPSGIELATFWLVTHCLNKLNHRVPHINVCISSIQQKCQTTSTMLLFITFAIPITMDRRFRYQNDCTCFINRQNRRLITYNKLNLYQMYEILN